jgi:hypothetical protein
MEATKITIRDTSGNLRSVTLTKEILDKEPDLGAIVERIDRLAARVADYGDSYDRGGGHDKTHDKQPGHGKEHSKST